MIVGAADPEDYLEIYDIVDRAFKHSELESRIITVTTREDPNFQKGDLRVVKIDRKIVSMMMIIRRPLRIGTAIVKGGIVSPVATHPDFQGKGHCSAVMRDAVQYMKSQGFDIAILWGHPWLYPHYGYSPAMLKTELIMKPSQSSSVEKSHYHLRPFAEGDSEKITQIYHSNTATRTCAEVRSPKAWEWKPRDSEVELEVLVDRKGEVIGYHALGTDWGRPCAHEIGASNDRACEAIFGNLLEAAKEKELKEFHCIIHPNHPFARFAFWRDGEIRINRAGGAGMARVLNLVSLLTKMEKEFERRLCHSELHDLECTLKISTDEGSAVLNITHGQVNVCPDEMKCEVQLDIPLSSLNPLVTGFKGIKELIEDPDLEISNGKRAVRIVEVLFPFAYPFGGHIPLVWE